MRGLIVGVVIVAVIAIVVFFYINNSKNGYNTTSKQSTQESTNNSSDTSTDTTSASSSVTITYTDSGFSPNTVKVTSGGSVTVKNDSGSQIQFDSNPHPDHTDNAELNLGVVGAGGSKSFTVTKTGSWSYHNHLNQSEGGSIVVE